MAGKNKAAKFEGMTDDQILAKAKALEDKFRNTPARKRPQDFYDFGNKAVEINRMRRAARKNARMSKEKSFDTGLTTTWGVPKGMETTRNRLTALIMQESGPRADAVPEYTLLGERLVASAIRNYMDKYGLTAPELISGKGRYGGPAYLTSINDVQKNPERSVYDWENDKFNRAMFVHDDTTFNHMTNAARLASALVNGTLRPLTTATNFKHLVPDEEFNGMTKVDYDFGAISVPTNKVLKLYIDPKLKRSVRQAAGAGDTEGPEVPVEEPVPQAVKPVPEGGPRIVINPEVFEDKRDALCVAMNEAFRVLMEVNGFNPVSEPTEAQRAFFADTAYSRNENQMRRTILARICTFDTSVKDPTEEQLHESVEFLETIMEMGAPQNEWEQQAVQRIHDVLAAALENGMTQSTPQEPAPVDEPAGDETQMQAAVGGGTTEEEEPASLDAPPQGGENGYVEGDNGGSIPTEAVNEATSEASGSQQTAMTEGASEPGQTDVQKEGPQRDKSGYFRDDDGRVISEREAQKLWNEKPREQPVAGPVNEQPDWGEQSNQNGFDDRSLQIADGMYLESQRGSSTQPRKNMTPGKMEWHRKKQTTTGQRG